MKPEKEGTDCFFSNLRQYGQAARTAGIPLRVSMLSVGHFQYRCQSEDDFRWQIGAAVASGCMGIIWFLFYNQAGHDSYRRAPIEVPFGKTETYDYLFRAQRAFAMQYGKLMTQLKMQMCYHVQKAYGGFGLFPSDSHPLIRDVRLLHGMPGIVSFLKMAKVGNIRFCVTTPRVEAVYSIWR